MKLYQRQFVAGYLSSVSLLIVIFVRTMIKHDQRIDISYLLYAVAHIIVILIFSGIITAFLIKKKTILSIFVGAFAGFGLAAAYLYFTLY